MFAQVSPLSLKQMANKQRLLMTFKTIFSAQYQAWPAAILLVFSWLMLAVSVSAEEPQAKPLKLPPVETLSPEKVDDLDTDNPAYRPANELVVKSRELLKVLNVDQSLLRQALQGVELRDEDLELLLEMLFRLPQLDIERIEELVQPLPAWEKLNDETPRYLGGVYRLRGIVKNFQDLTPPEYNSAAPNLDETLDGSLKRMASRRTIPHLYRTDILVSGKVLEVYSNRVPQAWLKKKKGEALAAWQGGQEVEVWGYLLKQGDPDNGPAYYFAAPRVRWYPNTTLGKLGFDYELFDDVQQKRTLLKGENEIFYEYLATAKRTPAEIYQLAKTQENEIVELWKNPEKQVGELMTFRGLTRHVARIAVEDPALAKRLGFDHYYYLELFVPLKTPTIVQIQMTTKDDEDPTATAEAISAPTDSRYVRLAKNTAVAFSQALRFDQIHFESMPLVFYFHELPPGETVLSLKNKQVEIRGFFLKSWRYQSNVPLTNKQHASLFGPLLMGNRPEIIVMTPMTGANIPGLLILSVIAASVLAGIFYLWLNQRDRNKRPMALPEKIDLSREELDS